MEDSREKKIRDLLNNKNFRIKNVSEESLKLYDQALTHSSYARENFDQSIEFVDNERLEFLGNFVLGFIVSEFLYSTFDFSEGAMTIRMEVVSDANIANLVKDLDLHLEDGFLLLGKRHDNNQIQLENSIIAGWFEAFIGAVYLDQGIDKAKEIILGLFSDRIRNFDPRRNYIGRLQEFVHKHKLGELEYKDERITGPDHRPTFLAKVVLSGKLIGEGTGANKKTARMNAAKNALKNL
jgi:ribonuclease-3